MEKKHEWLRGGYNKAVIDEMNGLMSGLGLNTVCNEAACPNRTNCYKKKTATFMILGTNCTRRCRFCNVTKAPPCPVDENEPENLSRAVKALGLSHAVITSVTRDDLPDGGAAHFAAVTRAVKALGGVTAELLIPDLGGCKESLKTVLAAGPDVLGHNLETVPRLYPSVRPGADYRRSLEVLSRAREISPGVVTKTGIMLGLGETREELSALFADCAARDCDILTIGQYLRPSKLHLPVEEYVRPEVFDELGELARRAGIKYVHSAPLVRSSYNAAEGFAHARGLRP